MIDAVVLCCVVLCWCCVVLCCIYHLFPLVGHELVEFFGHQHGHSVLTRGSLEARRHVDVGGEIRGVHLMVDRVVIW